MSEGGDVYLEPERAGRAELQIRRSRFLAQVCLVGDEEASREALREIGRSLADANHHCWPIASVSPRRGSTIPMTASLPGRRASPFWEPSCGST